MARKGLRKNGVAGFLRAIRKQLPSLRDRYGIGTMGLFGSHVRGKQGRGSDLDILIEYERTPTLLEFVALEHELGDLLDVKVDLVMKSALKPEIGQRILAEVVPACDSIRRRRHCC